MRNIKLWQCIETFDDGSEFVRTSGSYALCELVARELLESGFRADVRPASEPTAIPPDRINYRRKGGRVRDEL
jgi:hypothetical protein